MDLDEYDEGTQQPYFDDTFTEIKTTPKSTLSFANSPVTPHVATPNVRDQEGEITRLNKKLFNMKLRVFYLEQRLAKSGMSGDEDVSALAKENYELKMLVDEKASELEDRNVLLVKARTAIENLQAEVDSARSQVGNVVESKQKVLIANAREADKLRQEQATTLDKMTREATQEREQLQNQVTATLHERNDAVARCQELQEEVDEARKNMQKLREQLEIKEDEKHDFANRMKQSTQESFTELRSEIQRRDNEINRHRLEADNLRMQLLAQATELKQWHTRETNLKQKAAEVAQLEAMEIMKLQNENKTLKDQITNFSHTTKHTEEEKRRYEDLLVDNRQRIQELHLQVEEKAAELNRLRGVNKELEDSARAKAVAMEVEATKRQTEVRALASAESLQLQQELAKLKGKISVLQNSRNEAEKEADEQRRRCLEAKQQAMQLVQELEQARDGTSSDVQQLQMQTAASHEQIEEERRKLREAKEKYEREIVRMQRKAADAMASAESQLADRSSSENLKRQAMLTEMREWEASVVKAIESFKGRPHPVSRLSSTRTAENSATVRQRALKTLADLSKERAQFEAHVRLLEKDMRARNAELESRVEELHRRLGVAHSRVDIVRAKVQSRPATSHHNQSEVAYLSEQLKLKNDLIAELRSSMKVLQHSSKELQDSLKRLSENNRVLILEVEHRQQEIKECRLSLASARKHIKELQSKQPAQRVRTRKALEPERAVVDESVPSHQRPIGNARRSKTQALGKERHDFRARNSTTTRQNNSRLRMRSRERRSVKGTQADVWDQNRFRGNQRDEPDFEFSSAPYDDRGRYPPRQQKHNAPVNRPPPHRHYPDTRAYPTKDTERATNKLGSSLDLMHNDMLAQLTKIGSDLQRTATSLEAFQSPPPRNAKPSGGRRSLTPGVHPEDNRFGSALSPQRRRESSEADRYDRESANDGSASIHVNNRGNISFRNFNHDRMR